MNFFEQLIAETAILALLLIVIGLVLLWVFISSAVKNGTKNALYEFYNETINADKIKELKQKEYKEEMDSWN